MLLGFSGAVMHKAMPAQGQLASVYTSSGERYRDAVACGTVVALVLHSVCCPDALPGHTNNISRWKHQQMLSIRLVEAVVGNCLE